ncbi:type IV toxin-antitoxin system AbiEi family antitoxin domain-containing protein [Cellulomonas endometrii]|uniref:type IV toxin-antitoxin system AbiEi family antitoxin domain-containing protein n=1 Tax=Cellulomonas endometrii TaxID=3036301 RepID=UPI0024AE189C|nr:type IV toxin-antitoxin system AbiEi family antitoxin domain-containing protein [Cellulomonas endometrii]
MESPVLPLAPGCVVSAAEAGARGMGPDALAAAVRAGALVRVRRGMYADGTEWREASDVRRHLLRVRAADRALGDPVFSHRSAAAVWGVPVLGGWSDLVDVAVGPATGGRSRNGVRRRTSTVPPRSVVRDGLRVTPPATTAVDLARTEGFASGLVAVDHTLRELVRDAAVLECALDRLGTAWGVRRARRVLASADPLAESPGESLSRARMIEHGLPRPELQHVVTDAEGTVGRVDFWWPDLRLVGEFDGRVKYRVGGVPDGRALEDRVWAEKLREDRLRALGLSVVRWTWADALDGSRLVRRLSAAGLTPPRR